MPIGIIGGHQLRRGTSRLKTTDPVAAAAENSDVPLTVDQSPGYRILMPPVGSPNTLSDNIGTTTGTGTGETT